MNSLDATHSATALVGRQAIYDQELHVCAYELLYRDGQQNAACVTDGDAATADVMLNTVLEIGLEQVIEHHRAFINVTSHFICAGLCEALPQDRVVLEVLEDVQPTPEVIHALAALADKGYTIALDDFAYDDALSPLLDIAHLVKLDVMALSREDLQAHVECLAPYAVDLLAEKVETHDDFEFCKALGCKYFQGYFLCKPNIVSGGRVSSNRLASLKLLGMLHDDSVEFSVIEREMKNDVLLSYKMLRYVNSAQSGLPQNVDSIGRAACLIGRDKLKIWVTLMSLSNINDKPRELLVIAATRAHMCEQLGRALQLRPLDPCFTTGLFSALDGFFDCELPEALQSLPLADDIRNALVRREGALGEMLNCVLAYEQGRWEQVVCGTLPSDAIQAAFVRAIKGASEMLAGIVD